MTDQTHSPSERSDMLRCPYCGRSVRACEGERRSMRAHREDPYVPGKCPASGLTVEEAQHTRPAEQLLEQIAEDYWS